MRRARPLTWPAAAGRRRCQLPTQEGCGAEGMPLAMKPKLVVSGQVTVHPCIAEDAAVTVTSPRNPPGQADTVRYAAEQVAVGVDGAVGVPVEVGVDGVVGVPVDVPVGAGVSVELGVGPGPAGSEVV